MPFLSFTRLKAQFIKELLSILRDPRSRLLIFMPPLLQLLIFAFAATLEVRHVNIAIYNQDTGRWSHELISQLDQAHFIHHIHYVNNKEKLQSLLDQAEVIATLTIPADFSRLIASNQRGSVQVLVDGRRSNSGQITMSYLAAISAAIDTETNAQQNNIAPLAVRNWFNPNLNYRWFIVPSLSGILSFFSALLITALSIARERELGTFDQLLVSPTSITEIILSKSLPALLIGSLLGLMMIAAAVILFSIPFSGSLGWLLCSLFLFILSVVGIGLMISAISATQQQAILGAFALGVPAILLSGFATPIENMPVILQWVAQAIPLTHYLVIVQGSFLKALSFNDIAASLWPLAIIAFLSLTLATVFVKGRLQ